ncbi:MAG TPA: carbohydrate-binding module family 20 domain-containing protein, partial [Flavisolibacter sp.]|nr:carbohydrate-binding module family 20 domain-containing protein [Flavisolibacter sp.]
MRIDFYLRFHTQFGQTISLVGNIPSLGLNDANKALPLTFFNEEFWHTSIEIDPADYHSLHYRYVFTNEFGERKKEAEKERVIELKKNLKDVVCFDTWNDESFYENAFFTAPFTDVFLSTPGGKKQKKLDTITHTIKIKAPLVGEHEAVFITGNSPAFNNWDIENPLLLQKKGNWWMLEADLSGTIFPVAYKYGIYDLKKEAFVKFEEGDN